MVKSAVPELDSNSLYTHIQLLATYTNPIGARPAVHLSCIPLLRLAVLSFGPVSPVFHAFHAILFLGLCFCFWALYFLSLG